MQDVGVVAIVATPGIGIVCRRPKATALGVKDRAWFYSYNASRFKGGVTRYLNSSGVCVLPNYMWLARTSISGQFCGCMMVFICTVPVSTLS